MTDSGMRISDLTAWHDGELGGYDRSGSESEEGFHFLHGNGFCARTLEPVAALLPNDRRLLFTDAPGHGVSHKPDSIQPDWNAMAATIAESIISRTSGPLVGVGHSMGGVMTLLMAAAQPNLFTRIILLDPALFSSEILLTQRLLRKTGFWQRTKLVKAVQQRRRRWPSKDELQSDLGRKSLYRSWHPSALDAFVEFGTYSDGAERVLSCDPFWEASIFGSYPYQLWHSVRSVKCPVYILVAEKSYPFINRAARRAASINRNVAWFEQPGTHCFPMEDPEATAAFIKRLAIPASGG
ncbi:alpha/beta fold hydrolase [Thalassolituus oleivorans]|uniref:alpha/beta fold hydrolase n=1 Tax=Thalassolituus oleivorans TaxID=187493 RepID=UPI001CE2A970|nr:alpha/beta hydrolase [Thalassolituus oleivorans]MCA6127895.1 hypothetical protein [Thalassolituus oleivorans 4BN06-13]